MIRIGIDIGGTFTDFAVWRGSGEGYTSIESFKVLSTPPTFGDAVIEGMETLLGRIEVGPDEPVIILHGTTVSTNAVIERVGPPIALLTTAGFKDILNIQRLRVKNPTNLFGQRPLALIPRQRVYEIAGRIGPDGAVEQELDAQAIRAAVDSAVAEGVSSIIISFLHSYRNASHEITARDIVLAHNPAVDVTLSSEIWPEQGEYERTAVAALNGFVKRRTDAYLSQVEQYVSRRLPQARLFITKSNGGAMSVGEARRFPVHTLLSGPASGVTATCYLAAAMDVPNVLTMDMGGTSTDLSLIREAMPTVSNEAEVGDFPLMMPVTGIEAIGAGGGSIASVDGLTLTVGPESAGSRPGPACYGRGGTRPTLSDAYLLCGFLDPRAFLHGRMTLNRDLSVQAMQPIADRLQVSLEAAAQACIDVATSNMVAHTLPYLARHGVAARDLALVLYGGAGAVHGTFLAEEVGIDTVIVPRIPSVFCAFGGLVSNLVSDSVRSLRGEDLKGGRLRELYSELETESLAWLHRQLPAAWLIGHAFHHVAEMRYSGQSFEVRVTIPGDVVRGGETAAFERAFHEEHLRLYSHSDPGAGVEFVTARVRITGSIASPQARPQPGASGAGGGAVPCGTRALYLRGTSYPKASVYSRQDLPVGSKLAGPAIVEQGDATILIPAEFTAQVGPMGDLILKRNR